jgi:hypothetical protein
MKIPETKKPLPTNSVELIAHVRTTFPKGVWSKSWMSFDEHPGWGESLTCGDTEANNYVSLFCAVRSPFFFVVPSNKPPAELTSKFSYELKGVNDGLALFAEEVKKLK